MHTGLNVCGVVPVCYWLPLCTCTCMHATLYCLSARRPVYCTCMYPHSGLRGTLLICMQVQWADILILGSCVGTPGWLHQSSLLSRLSQHREPSPTASHGYTPTKVDKLALVAYNYLLRVLCILFPQRSFWKGLYCRYPLKQHVCELTGEILGSLKQQNTCLTEHIKFLQQVHMARKGSMGVCIIICNFVFLYYGRILKNWKLC